MKLLGVEKDGAWLFSEWNLTYRVGWEHILRAAALIWEYTEDPEIIVGDASGERAVKIGGPDDVSSIEESGRLTVRGVSKIIGVPLSVTFFNQLDLVRATVACANEEFSKADYREFNLSMCQFMDSAELSMYG
ncbi:MAG: hypothetical protein IJU75_01930 [Clostridia bacterium]|nr:hypothetical protein [Clostridia bacterium]MBQ7603691.1 hypothetical protein [Clostridia bacterium]